jgi:uncharacterized membrane protein
MSLASLNMQYVVAYAAAAAAFFLADMLWLGKIAKSFYREQLGHLLAERFRTGVAGLFYAFYVVGIVIFAISPALQAGLWELAFGYGALFGLFAYGTYDMTNLATLRRWPVEVSMLDMAWGTFLSGSAAAAGYVAAQAYATL